MKVLAINGSPRKGGNTEILLNRALTVLKEDGIEGEIIQVGGTPMRGCMACGHCHKVMDGTCAIKDDNFHEILLKMKEADIIIVGSPVYFGSATPELMALLDRAGYVGRSLGYFTRKVGGPITMARRAGQNFTYAQLMYWFMINEFIVPGSSYWNIGFGKEKGDVQSDTEANTTIERFAENLAWLAGKLA